MKRPAKPRIQKANLTWRWNKHKLVWEPYHRTTWSQDGKQKEKNILLKWEGDPKKLDTLYWACRSGTHEAQQAPAKYTWEECVRLWRADPRVQAKLSDRTKKTYRADMDDILEKNAKKDMRQTTKKAIRAKHADMSETTRKADKMLSMVSLLWNYAKNKQDWPLGDNPTKGVDHYGKQTEFKPWPDWMVEKLGTAPLEVQIAAQIILNTGQRPDAAITMRFDQVQGEDMILWDDKADEEFTVHCPPDFRRFVESIPRNGAHMLAKNLRQPLGYDAIEKRFRRWRSGLGDKAKPFVLHGLRKLAIVNLALAGWSDAQIQALTNQSLEMVLYYRRMADRRKLTKAAHQNRTKTE